MTACYEKLGIRFLYPENWKVADEQFDESPHSVSVESPDSGFWSLLVYDEEIDPRALLEQVLESMCEEYEGVESSLVSEQFDDVESLGYDMYFCCLDFIVNSRALAFRAGGKTLLMMWQAEDREFEQLEPVFRAITISLIQAQRADGASLETELG
jgi:hypothetical protein